MHVGHACLDILLLDKGVHINNSETAQKTIGILAVFVMGMLTVWVQNRRDLRYIQQGKGTVGKSILESHNSNLLGTVKFCFSALFFKTWLISSSMDCSLLNQEVYEQKIEPAKLDTAILWWVLCLSMWNLIKTTFLELGQRVAAKGMITRIQRDVDSSRCSVF